MRPPVEQAVHAELRALAARAMAGERRDHTLQPTALVHEAYLRLAGAEKESFESRAHFLAVASRVMRSILVDHARAKRAAKRSGGPRVELEPIAGVSPERDVVLAVDEAASRLAAKDPQLGRIVEMRFFGGLTTEEMARVLDVAPRTVERGWATARAWLRRELRDGE